MLRFGAEGQDRPAAQAAAASAVQRGVETSQEQRAVEEACRVRAADLAHLQFIHETLSVLNDECAGAAAIARCIEKLPPLRARLARRYQKLHAHTFRKAPPVVEQLAHLGNRELEGVLLELLEDLTILRADLADARIRPAHLPAVSLPPLAVKMSR